MFVCICNVLHFFLNERNHSWSKRLQIHTPSHAHKNALKTIISILNSLSTQYAVSTLLLCTFIWIFSSMFQVWFSIFFLFRLKKETETNFSSFVYGSFGAYCVLHTFTPFASDFLQEITLVCLFSVLVFVFISFGWNVFFSSVVFSNPSLYAHISNSSAFQTNNR